MLDDFDSPSELLSRLSISITSQTSSACCCRVGVELGQLGPFTSLRLFRVRRCRQGLRFPPEPARLSSSQQSSPSSTPSPSPLFLFCINLNWLQSYLNSLLSTTAMFSRAIRQSGRRVAAISASSRIASVSPSQPPAIAPAAPSAIASSC